MDAKKTHLGYTLPQWALLFTVAFATALEMAGKLPLEKETANMLAGALIGLLANLIIAFIQSNQSTKELETAAAGLKILSKQIDDKVSQMDVATTGRDNNLGELVTRIREQVLNLEDASRKALDSFAKIFRQARAMLSQARMKKVWILTFTPCFGRIHATNGEVLSQFFKLENPTTDWNQGSHGQDWIRRITKEADELGAMIEGFASSAHVNFRLATLPPDEVERQFFSKIQAKLISTNPADDVKKAKDKHALAIAHINGHTDRDTKLEFVQSLPLQIFITQYEVDDVDRSGVTRGIIEETACLVFFIGTDTVGSHVHGFYTRFPELAKLFEKVFESIVSSNPATYTLTSTP